MAAVKKIHFDYKPAARQFKFHTTAARQILYGGAAGGGKSKALRMDLALACMSNPGLAGYLFRRTLPELEMTHIQALKAELPQDVASFNETKKVFEFFNGSTIRCCYCEREDDVMRYQSAEIHHLAVDEATHFTAGQINYLKTRNRLGGFKPSKAWEKALPRVVFASNPGGPGHSYFKALFIDGAPPETMFFDTAMKDPEFFPDGWPSIYIPARMADNPHLDKGYAASFGGLAPELRRALVEGDWDAVEGAAVPISRDKHRVRQFAPPKHWTRFMAIDWGMAAPFCVGWFCVSDGAILEAKDGWPQAHLPAGAIVLYREWYGWSGKPNVGCRLDSKSVARRILAIERDAGETMDYRIADSAMWAQTDGPTVAENMMSVDERMALRSTGGKDRAAGYNEICQRLAGDADGEPMFYATVGCTHFWRTVPILTFDENDPEKGPDTNLEDHAYDCTVYGLRSRPFTSTQEARYEAEMKPFMKYRKSARAGNPYATA